MVRHGFVWDQNPKEAKAAFDLIETKVNTENAKELLKQSQLCVVGLESTCCCVGQSMLFLQSTDEQPDLRLRNPEDVTLLGHLFFDSNEYADADLGAPWSFATAKVYAMDTVENCTRSSDTSVYYRISVLWSGI